MFYFRQIRYAYTKGIVKTGIVAIIEGKIQQKTILLRADLDALPIEEKNNVEYKSQNVGITYKQDVCTQQSC
ncbi:MAG: hypothetical protein IPL10_15850 [Bacteroidetes bacterium]|nr:hypothetical protein [Bacteroidota bacterium]